MSSILFQFLACILLLGGDILALLPMERLSLAEEWNSYNEREPEGPGTYAFGYDVADEATGNTHFREEQRHPNGTVTGSYGWVDPQGRVTVVSYVADKNGYRATIKKSSTFRKEPPLIDDYKPPTTVAPPDRFFDYLQPPPPQPPRPFDNNFIF